MFTMTDDELTIDVYRELVETAKENPDKRLEVDADVIAGFEQFFPDTDTGDEADEVPVTSFERRIDNLLQGTPCEGDTALRANLIELCMEVFEEGAIVDFEHWTVDEGDLISMTVAEGYDRPPDHLWGEMIDNIAEKLPDEANLVEGAEFEVEKGGAEE